MRPNFYNLMKDNVAHIHIKNPIHILWRKSHNKLDTLNNLKLQHFK